MKKLFIRLVCALMLLGAINVNAASVSKIYGLAGDGTGSPTASLFSVSFLCDGTGAILDCPQWFAPDWVDGTGLRFFGITNRTNPPRCLQSTTGGIGNWSLCPSNPYSAAVDGFGAFFTVASDGSLISAADQGTDNCIIRRSTDYGVSWTTVFTDTAANVSCGVSFGTPTTNVSQCTATTGYCVVMGRQTASFNLIAYFSVDNGANWTKGTPFSIVNGNEQLTVKVDGSVGSMSRLGVNYGGLQPLGERIISDWATTTATPQPGGAVGTASNGAAAVIFDGQETVITGPTSNPNTTHYRYTIAGGIPLEVASFIPAGAPAFANGPQFMAHGRGSTGYMITRNLAGTVLNVYATIDGWDTVHLIAALTPTTALIPACCTGDIHNFNGKIYFTDGGTASQAVFGIIQ